MIFIKGKGINLCVPSRENLAQWTQWINEEGVRITVPSTRIPKTEDMQWSWIQNQMKTGERLLLEITDTLSKKMLGVVSLSNINYEKKSAQISTISPTVKNKDTRFCVYEARRMVVEYAFFHLSLHKVYGGMAYPHNAGFLVNNMCIGFQIEGVSHAEYWIDDSPVNIVNYFITRNRFYEKDIISQPIKELLKKTNRDLEKKMMEKTLSMLISPPCCEF